MITGSLLGGVMLLGSMPPPARILALGDSYTIGEAVAESERWPVQLTELLRANGIVLQPPQIIARTGWTTDELAAAINDAAPTGPYPLVSLLIGVNNQYRGRPVDEYRGQFAELLETAIGFAGAEPGRVLVLSIPDWSLTPFAKASGRDPAAISNAIDQYNQTALDVVQARGAHWINITELTREAAERPELLATDGLHPSAFDYLRWAEAALPSALKTLKGLRQTRQAR